MLYFVLLLVAAALAGVVAALITANSLWAWISIGLSVLAGLILLVDWIRRRPGGTSAAAATSAGTEPSTGEPPDDESSAAESAETGTAEAEHDEATDAETTTASAVDSDGQPVEQGPETQPAAAGTPDETERPATEPTATTVQDVPDEEQTDAADALIISDLDAEVLVVDEYPRYHLDACGWLTGRETIPITVSEARELGFGPCAQCEPDAALASKHRNTRKKFRTRADS